MSLQCRSDVYDLSPKEVTHCRTNLFDSMMHGRDAWGPEIMLYTLSVSSYVITVLTLVEAQGVDE